MTPVAARPLNVLIVDDSAMMRAMIRRAIQMTGVDIGVLHEAANGREALAVLEAGPIDALFTDINMPVMSGPELLREMGRRGWNDVYRVIVSTDGSLARRDEVSDLNVRMYVEKPFAPEAIREALLQVCDGRR
jgi:two-component system chemotaxis response regulator CheY